MATYKTTSDTEYTGTRPSPAVRRESSSGAWIVGGIAAVLLLLGIGYLASGNSPVPVGTQQTTTTDTAPVTTPAAPPEQVTPGATPSAPATDPAAPVAPANPPAGGNTTTTP